MIQIMETYHDVLIGAELVTPYGDIDLGKHWLKEGLITWWQHNIT